MSVDLKVGQQQLAIYQNGSWVPHIVEVSAASSLLLIDLDEPLHSQHTTDNAGTGKDRSEAEFIDIGRMNLGQRYVYEKVLGRGGMSLVIRAKDRLLNRSVAIKMLAEELLGNEEAQSLLLGEAR